MYAIGELSKKFNLSRGTLLFYDSLGLLTPAARTKSNYRLYSEADVERLTQICIYRETGLPLLEIKQLLDSARTEEDLILEKHLTEVNQSIRQLELQRQIILGMIRTKSNFPEPHSQNHLITVLQQTGLDDAALERLHREFENRFPLEHQSFLEYLGFSPEQIRLIREHSKIDPKIVK